MLIKFCATFHFLLISTLSCVCVFEKGFFFYKQNNYLFIFIDACIREEKNWETKAIKSDSVLNIIENISTYMKMMLIISQSFLFLLHVKIIIWKWKWKNYLWLWGEDVCKWNTLLLRFLGADAGENLHIAVSFWV